MFNTAAIFTIKIPPKESGKSVDVRWPRDGEWCERARGIRVVHTTLGRSTTAKATGVQAANAKLFAAIRSGDDVELDDAEIAYVIDKLSRAEVIDVIQEGSTRIFTVKVIRGTVAIAASIPTLKAVQKYRRAAASSQLQGKERITRIFLEPYLELWQSVRGAVEGYPEGVEPPIVHLEPVLDQLIEELDRLADEDDGDSDPED